MISLHKFFVEKNQIQDNNIYISGKDLIHIKNVLRLKPADKIEISCGGTNYLAEIIEFSKENIITRIINSSVGNRESSIEITLYQGLAKGSKMDLIIQKCVEIGVKDFYAIETDRAVVKITDKKKEDTKIQRWQSIAEEAAKQSKRDYIPKIKGIISFNEMIDILKEEKNIIVPYENEENLSIKDGLKAVEGNKINLIIGPEGGFENNEIKSLENIGASIVTLGHRILRTETAGLVSSTIILYELGDLGVI